MAIPSLDERIVVHAPPGAQHAIERAAIHAHLSPAQFLRQLVMACGPTASSSPAVRASICVRGRHRAEPFAALMDKVRTLESRANSLPG